MKPKYTKILEAISIYIIIPLFLKFLLDLSKNISSSFSILLSSNDDI